MTIRPLHTPPATPPAERAERAASSPAAEKPALSEAERSALAQQFPENAALTMRLYGPARAAEPSAPLGTRLDLRG